MNYTIIGAGKSGLAAALLAKELGYGIFLSELKPVDDFRETYNQLIKYNIPFEFGKNSESVLETDCIILSPGVPPTAPIIQEAEKRNIKIISELEFAYRHLTNPIIAITGTNGKTTTTTLTSFILNNAGRKAIPCGNIGTPLSSFVDKISSDTILVAEVSSFQLDRIEKFRPQVAAILNITPDHLYYHGSMENYINSKFKIFSNQIEKNLLILNNDDPLVAEAAKHTKSEVAMFSLNPMQQGIYIIDGRLVVRFKEQHEEEEIMLVNEIGIPGAHNVYNSLAAAAAARAFEVRNENIRDSLMAFTGVEHRLEFVRTLDGVDYINDSKATNINATWFGLSSYCKPIVWIAGGRGDSNDYSKLDLLVRKNVKAIIAIGEEQDAIFNHYCTMVRCIKASSMEDAMNEARRQAEDGDIVLFTPACKSFDMFFNYEHRGHVFKEIVNNLI
jgi:UDP-N-acetylmuramoylalanine--D-glutamate ligase